MRMVVHSPRVPGAERQAGVRPTNVSLDAALVDEARALGVNISQASARGLEQAVKQARSEQWLAENKAALEASNAFVEKHGLPLARYRQF
jgi:antitoxin CcdA